MWKTHTNRRGKNWLKETASRVISPEKEPPTEKTVQPQSGARRFFNEHNILDFLPTNPDSQTNGQKENEADKTNNNTPSTDPEASNTLEEPEAPNEAPIPTQEDPDDEDPDDSNYDSDSSDDTNSTMREERNLLELQGHMQRDVKCNMTPTTEPTKLELIKFKNSMATALTKCESITLNVGAQLYLITTEDEYRTRVGDQTAIVPTYPKVPMFTGELSSTYKFARKVYLEKVRYNRQAVDIIIQKFPGGLDGMEKEGELPIDLQAKDALDHLTEQVNLDEDEVNESYNELMMNLLSRKHVISANGAEEWFKQAENDRLMAQKLGFQPIPYGIIISSSLAAFKKSGYNRDATSKISLEWKTKVAQHKYHTDNETCYRAFRKYYNKELSLLYINTDKKKGKAFQAADATWKREIESDIEQLNSNQHSQAAAYQAELERKPPAIEIQTGSGTNVGADSTIASDRMNRFEQRMEQAMAAMTRALSANALPSTTATSPRQKYGGNKTRENRTWVWKQYVFWCYTCGVNLSHHSCGCRRKTREGHGTHPTATYTDPQGGNPNRIELFGKWSSPEGKVCDTKDG